MNPSASKSFKKRITTFAVCVFSLILLALFLNDPEITAGAAAGAVRKCGALLIPSLFPLMAASEIAIVSGAAEKLLRPIAKIISKIFGIKKEASAPVILGLFCGYTAAISGALSLLKKKRITNKDCEWIITSFSIPSLPFITGFLGSSVLKNTTDGWILWIISICSSFIIGFFVKSKNKCANLEFVLNGINEENSPKKPFPKIIVEAISHSSASMILICACVIFFSSLTEAIRQPLCSLGLPDIIQKLLLGTVEITGGVLSLSDLTPYAFKCAVCAFFLGWSGLSIHFQIIAMCDGYGLSFKRFFFTKLMQGLLCAALAFVIFTFKF